MSLKKTSTPTVFWCGFKVRLELLTLLGQSIPRGSITGMFHLAEKIRGHGWTWHPWHWRNRFFGGGRGLMFPSTVFPWYSRFNPTFLTKHQLVEGYQCLNHLKQYWLVESLTYTQMDPKLFVLSQVFPEKTRWECRNVYLIFQSQLLSST